MTTKNRTKEIIEMNRKSLLFAITVLLILVGLIVPGCGKKEQDVTKIGAVLPLTGELALYGQKCKKGMDVAVELINEKGGIGGKRVEVILEDSRSIASDGVSAAQKLVTVDKVQAIIGEVSSSISLAIVPVIDNAKVVLFSPASSSPKLSGASKYFVRNWPSDVAEASQLADLAYDSLGLRKAAVMYANNDYGLGLKDRFQARFAARGGQIVAAEAYTIGNNDFRTVIQKIKARNPDAIFLGGYKEMGIATKQIREAGLKVQILACTNFGDNEILTAAGRAAEGAIFGTPVYSPEESKDPAIEEFVEAYKKRFNELPSLFEANGYDAVMIIANAIKERGNNGEKIAEYIRGLKNYSGGAGLISFNSDGDVERPIGFKRVRNNTFVAYSR
jgi:branched-chain amino acid transport system substrate-binding protein